MEVEESRDLVMYETLFSILVRRQLMMPFQLMKGFLLFDEDEPSIEVSTRHMPY